jgi:hypothetical protein
MLFFTRLLAFALCAAGLHGYCQKGSATIPAAQFDPQMASSHAETAAATNNGYTFPDGKQQFRNYLYYTFGPPGLISTAIGAAIDQSKPAPPEWDSGPKGYAERYGWRFAMNMTTKTTEYSLGTLMHEDVAYHPCACSGFVPRTAHAFLSVLAARTPSGRSVPSLPSLVAPYVGSFTAVNAWYPNRYQPADAFRIGSMSFVFKAGGNLIGEFIAPRR